MFEPCRGLGDLPIFSCYPICCRWDPQNTASKKSILQIFFTFCVKLFLLKIHQQFRVLIHRRNMKQIPSFQLLNVMFNGHDKTQSLFHNPQATFFRLSTRIERDGKMEQFISIQEGADSTYLHWVLLRHRSDLQSLQKIMSVFIIIEPSPDQEPPYHQLQDV